MKNGKMLKIEIDAPTGVPTKPDTMNLAWQPEFDASENVLDCRPPWERRNDVKEGPEDRMLMGKRIIEELKKAMAAPPPPDSFAAMTAKHGRAMGPFEIPVIRSESNIQAKSWTRYTDEQLLEIYKKS